MRAQVTTRSAVAAGAALSLDYGARANGVLLFSYGFASCEPLAPNYARNRGRADSDRTIRY